jgi:hypothetical protein
MTHPESQAEREAFEAKCREAGHEFRTQRRGDSYKWPWQDAWWRVWKASAEHPRAAQSPVVAPQSDRPTKEELQQAIYDKVSRAEDLMQDIPPKNAVARYHEASKTLHEVVEQLFAAPPSTPAVPGWLPIETAPKDGTEVLLYLPAPWDEVRVAHWFAPWSNWQERDDPNPSRDEYVGIGSELPTHWQPLPAAPQPPKVAA